MSFMVILICSFILCKASSPKKLQRYSSRHENRLWCLPITGFRHQEKCLEFIFLKMRISVFRCATNICSFSAAVKFLNEICSLFRQSYTTVSFFRESQAPLKTWLLCDLNIGFVFPSSEYMNDKGWQAMYQHPGKFCKSRIILFRTWQEYQIQYHYFHETPWSFPDIRGGVLLQNKTQL